MPRYFKIEDTITKEAAFLVDLDEVAYIGKPDGTPEGLTIVFKGNAAPLVLHLTSATVAETVLKTLIDSLWEGK